MLSSLFMRKPDFARAHSKLSLRKVAFAHFNLSENLAN